MSERMKQYEFDEQRAALVRSAERWRYAGRIATEAERARASETVLADALADSAPRFSVSNGPCWCATNESIAPDDEDHGERCRSRRVAIRLAGRLP